MNSLAKAFDSVLKPRFTRYRNGRKRPTKASIERLTEKYGESEDEDHRTVLYYLVEVELGYVRDISARPTIFPAARMTYLSKTGRINTCLVKAVPTDEGKLEPKAGLKPTAVRPWVEGRRATTEEWQSYGPTLQRAHGLFLSTESE